MNKREVTKDGSGLDKEILNIRLRILVHKIGCLGITTREVVFVFSILPPS